jgi:hypothetical protein
MLLYNLHVYEGGEQKWLMMGGNGRIHPTIHPKDQLSNDCIRGTLASVQTNIPT